MKSNDLFRTLTTVTTVRPHIPKQNDLEVDDTAPLPLFIGIGLPVLIGFIILVLICCFCRRRRGAGARGGQPVAVQGANAANYHRAPEADGMGGPAGAYPMTAVPNSYGGFPPSGQAMGQQGTLYGPGPAGVRPAMHPPGTYPHPQQVPPPAAAATSHLGPGGPLQPYAAPPPQYVALVSPPPGAPHPHSLSHSSQASSASGHTADPLVPPPTSSSSPSVPQQQQHLMQQQQQYHQQQYHQQMQHQKELFHQQQFQHQQQLQYHQQHHAQPPVGLSRESPAPFLYTPAPHQYVMTGQPGLPDHGIMATSPVPLITASSTTPTPTPTAISNLSHHQLPSPTKSKPLPLGQGHLATSQGIRDDGTDQDLGYSEGEEE